jgi:Ca2+-binding RTX toxin-like protein
VSFAQRTTALSANLGSGGTDDGDSIKGFTRAIGGSANDTLIGDARDNVLEGGGGKDTIDCDGGAHDVAVDGTTLRHCEAAEFGDVHLDLVPTRHGQRTLRFAATAPSPITLTLLRNGTRLGRGTSAGGPIDVHLDRAHTQRRRVTAKLRAGGERRTFTFRVGA